jgi:histidinol dehydrogenase
MQPERFTLASGSRGDALALATEVRALALAPPELAAEVSEILADVLERGDDAVVELGRRFDSPEAPEQLRVPAEWLERALAQLDPAVREGLDVAIANVTRVCEAQVAGSADVELPQGQRVLLRELPVRRAGAYVPGGRAAYPSSAVMCCVPARVAGVEQVAVATPPGHDGRPSQVVLAACALCGVDEVYLMGGAQAIAALAFGTKSVEQVDVIVGPGSYYVQEAKRQVVGVVGIDAIAGPSELVVVADAEADALLAALDLAAQSEHGSESLLALLSPSPTLLDAVQAELETLAAGYETVSDAPVALVEVPDLDAAVELVNALAPEHLELACAGAELLSERVRAAGCIFVGAGGGGTAFGDYAAGSNHVLPTGRAARFASQLGPARFSRTQALVSLPERATRSLAPHVSSVARAEGFPVHAHSAEAREGPASDETYFAEEE